MLANIFTAMRKVKPDSNSIVGLKQTLKFKMHQFYLNCWHTKKKSSSENGMTVLHHSGPRSLMQFEKLYAANSIADERLSTAYT